MKKYNLIMTSFVILLLLASCQKSSKVSDNQPHLNIKLNGAITSLAALAASDGARHTLEGLIQNVTTADGKVYAAKDNTGKTLDCIKIIANPAGGYIGVYHDLING